MKDFQKTLKELRELSTINEETKALLEKMTGKELVDYESIDALVGALMTHYNGELKKKATTSHSHTWLEVTSKPTTFPPSLHNHDERYYTEEEIDTKFKNSVPVPVGGVLTMWNNTNPAELFSDTTWELITSGKYIQSGSTALSTGGSNSISIAKVNLPNVKLKVDTVSATIPSHYHLLVSNAERGQTTLTANNQIGIVVPSLYRLGGVSSSANVGKSGMGGAGNTGSISQNTETLGSGTALNIQPAYITLKFWKRLT